MTTTATNVIKVLMLSIILWSIQKPMTGTAHTSSNVSRNTAIQCIMGEARGEGLLGMQAVGEVLRRRDSTDGFYGCSAEFNEPEWVWEQAREAWWRSATSNITKGATHFESTDFPIPYWADKMKHVATVGKQKFYK